MHRFKTEIDAQACNVSYLRQVPFLPLHLLSSLQPLPARSSSIFLVMQTQRQSPAGQEQPARERPAGEEKYLWGLVVVSRVLVSTQMPEKRSEQPASSQEESGVVEWRTVKKRLPEKKMAGGLFCQQALTKSQETGGHGSGSVQ